MYLTRRVDKCAWSSREFWQIPVYSGEDQLELFLLRCTRRWQRHGKRFSYCPTCARTPASSSSALHAVIQPSTGQIRRSECHRDFLDLFTPGAMQLVEWNKSTNPLPRVPSSLRLVQENNDKRKDRRLRAHITTLLPFYSIVIIKSLLRRISCSCSWCFCWRGKCPTLMKGLLFGLGSLDEQAFFN